MDMNGKWNVYKRGIDGKITKLTPSNGRYYLSCIRPDGKYLVCQGGSFEDYLRIWRIDTNTKEMYVISPEFKVCWAPSYAWDGTQLVFCAETKSKDDIQKIQDTPAFFGPDKTISMSICVCHDDGRNFRQITSGKYMDLRPTFSPDGKRIAFISKRTGIWKLWEIDVDGNDEPVMIDADYEWAMRPWYSKDGNEIFFHTQIDQNHTIVRYNKTSQEIVPLANDDVGHTHGSFTLRNEDAILAHSNRGGDHALWKFPLDGTSPEEIVIDEIRVKAHATMSIDGTIIFDSPLGEDTV